MRTVWIGGIRMINKIIQGDCLEVMKDIEDNHFDLCLTDIPYNEVNRKNNGLRNLNKGIVDEVNFDMIEMLNSINRVCKGSFYIFCGIEQVSEIRKYFVEKGLSTRMCFWEKTNPSPMNGEYIWLSSVECIIYAKNSGSTFNGFCESPVFRYACGTNKYHPTQKPIKLLIKMIEISSNEGDLILDCFAGSCSTAVACKRMGRNFIMIEQDSDYCEIGRKRLKQEKSLFD